MHLIAFLFAGSNLFHAVKGAACLEPADLLLVQCVIQFDFVNFTVGMFDFRIERFARCQTGQTENRDFVSRLNLK